MKKTDKRHCYDIIPKTTKESFRIFMAHPQYQWVSVPQEILDDHPATIDKLCTLRLKGNFEQLVGIKLRGRPVFSMRINDTQRLLFVLIDGTLCFYMHLPTHNYDAAKRKIEADNKNRIDINQLLQRHDLVLLSITVRESDMGDEVAIADDARHIYYDGKPIALDDTQTNVLKTSTTTQVLTGPPGSGKTCVIAAQLVLWANEAAAPGLALTQSCSRSASSSSSSSTVSSNTLPRNEADTIAPKIFYITESNDLHVQMKTSMENQLANEALAHIDYCDYASFLKFIDSNTHDKLFLNQIKSKAKFSSDREINRLLLTLSPPTADTKSRKSATIMTTLEDKLYQEFLLMAGLSLEAYLNQGVSTSFYTHLPRKERTSLYMACSDYCQRLKNENIVDPWFYRPPETCFQKLRDNYPDLRIAVDETQDYPPLPTLVMHKAAYEQRTIYGIDTHQQMDKHIGLSIRPYLIQQLKATPLVLNDSYRLPNFILDISNITLNLKALASDRRISDKDDYIALERSAAQRAKSKVGFVKWTSMPAPSVKPPSFAAAKTRKSKAASSSGPHAKTARSDISSRLPQGKYLQALIDATQGRANIAVITRPELVLELKKLLGTTPVMAPQDIKGLQYDTIITWDLLHSSGFHAANTRLPQDALQAQSAQGRGKDKASQLQPSEIIHAFNALYTAQTRTTRALYMYEFEDAHHVGKIADAYRKTIQDFGDTNNELDAERPGVSSPKEWRELMNRYIQHNDLLNADAIWKDDNCWTDAQAERGPSFKAYREQLLGIVHPPKTTSATSFPAASSLSSFEGRVSSSSPAAGTKNKTLHRKPSRRGEAQKHTTPKARSSATSFPVASSSSSFAGRVSSSSSAAPTNYKTQDRGSSGAFMRSILQYSTEIDREFKMEIGLLDQMLKAIQDKNPNAILQLLKQRWQLKDTDYSEFLDTAFNYFCPQVIDLLTSKAFISRFFPGQSITDESQTVFANACLSYDLTTMARLLNAGLDCNKLYIFSKVSIAMTPLAFFAWRQPSSLSLAGILMLLNHNADIQVSQAFLDTLKPHNNNMLTYVAKHRNLPPLSPEEQCAALIQMAIVHKDITELSRLLANFPIDSYISSTESALTFAAARGGLECLNIVLNYHPSVDGRNQTGYTALMMACHDAKQFVEVESNEDDRLACILSLIKHGADINTQDVNDDTALHLAIKFNQKKIVATLIEHGARVTIRNKQGMDAFAIAKSIGNVQILPLIANAHKRELSAIQTPVVSTPIDAISLAKVNQAVPIKRLQDKLPQDMVDELNSLRKLPSPIDIYQHVPIELSESNIHTEASDTSTPSQAISSTSSSGGLNPSAASSSSPSLTQAPVTMFHHMPPGPELTSLVMEYLKSL